MFETALDVQELADREIKGMGTKTEHEQHRERERDHLGVALVRA